MSIGVVVAAYNAEHWLEAALQSVQEQRYGDWRCVVVDDGSRDGTADVVRRFVSGDQRFSLVQKPNGGPSSARNAGIAHLGSELEYVAFLDSDDLWLPDALETLWTALESRADAVGVAALAELIDGEGTRIHSGEHPSKLLARRTIVGWRTRAMRADEDITFRSLALNGSIWPPATALWRRERVVQAGAFDERLRLQEDWHLYLRIASLGPIASLPVQVAWYRRHDVNLTNDGDANLFAQDQVRRLAVFSSFFTRRQRLLAAQGRILCLCGALHAQAYGVYLNTRKRRLVPALRGVIGAVLLAADCVRFLPPPPSERRVRRTLAFRMENQDP